MNQTRYVLRRWNSKRSHAETIQRTMMGLATPKCIPSKARNRQKSGWIRERHGTRSTTKRKPDKADGDASKEQRDIVNAVIDQDKSHYGEAMKSEHRDKWSVAMIEELDALKANDVWQVVVPPRKVHFLHNKWVGVQDEDRRKWRH